MKLGIKLGLGIGLVSLFVYVFVAASGWQLRDGQKSLATAVAAVRGNYGLYLYTVTTMTSENKKVAQFDPALPARDDVVLGALRSLAHDNLGLMLDENQPAVETIHETNYITFTLGKEKVLFELFRNSSGKVGTVHFWKEAAH